MTSQITPADADGFLADLVLSSERSGWDALASGDKQVLLNRAQALLDSGTWDGAAYDDDQAFAFPRTDDDGLLIGVEAEPDPLAPLAIREALALLAWSFIDRGDLWEAFELRISGSIASHSAGGIAKAYTPRTGRSDAWEALRTVPDVWRRVERFWRRGGRIV